MVFLIAYRTHNAERRLAVAVPVVEVAHSIQIIGLKVFGLNLVNEVASLQPVLLIGLFPGRRFVALFPSSPSVRWSRASRGGNLGDVLGFGQA